MNFDTLLVGTIPLMLVIFGLIEFIKSFGLSGKILTILSMLLGVVFGLAYQFAVAGIPLTFSGWFEIVIFGLAIGLTASGFYKFINTRAPEALKDYNVIGYTKTKKG
jgi:hypothetical protein